jgi:hypothetical protein
MFAAMIAIAFMEPVFEKSEFIRDLYRKAIFPSAKTFGDENSHTTFLCRGANYADAICFVSAFERDTTLLTLRLPCHSTAGRSAANPAAVFDQRQHTIRSARCWREPKLS